MTHYQALEITENATAADIRRAYRRLVLLTHPDRTPAPAAHARYLAINAAYETLSDPARRQAYDLTLHGWAPIPAPTMSPGKARDARRPRRTGQRRAPAPPVVRYAAESARALQLMRPFLIGALLLCLFLALDLWLAKETVEQVLQTETFTYHNVYHYTERGTFMLPDELPVGTKLLLTRTPLRQTAISARLSPYEPVFVFRSVYGGASNTFWLGLLFTATLALTPRLSNDSRLVASFVAIVCLVLTLLTMFH
jgi:hypothetical protein